MSAPRVAVFLYGSYMSRDVLARFDVAPERIVPARLPGYDIAIGPMANVVPAADSNVHGVLTWASHAELGRLYASGGLGDTYLPEAVLVRTEEGAPAVALCYVGHGIEPAPATDDYIDCIVEPAREHGFPEAYIRRLESFRPG